MQIRQPTPALKHRGDINRNAIQGYFIGGLNIFDICLRKTILKSLMNNMNKLLISMHLIFLK